MSNSGWDEKEPCLGEQLMLEMKRLKKVEAQAAVMREELEAQLSIIESDSPYDQTEHEKGILKALSSQAGKKMLEELKRLKKENEVLSGSINTCELARAEAFEEAAQIVEAMKNGFTCTLDGTLEQDIDGPWFLKSDIAEMIRQKKGS